MDNGREILEKLPVHPGNRVGGAYALRVDGLVGKKLELTLSEFEGLSHRDVTEDFMCEEGWTVPAVRWWGVTLESVLNLAGINPEVQWVQASAGKFSVPIPLQDARKALLATRLGEAALPSEHGGPVRLVIPGGDCWTSIKWLDHLELQTVPGENTGKTIALGRCQTKQAP
jgi:DMSO/TMAO reductase YedYZ molybdopterin-dependent catalytic subunit